MEELRSLASLDSSMVANPDVVGENSVELNDRMAEAVVSSDLVDDPEVSEKVAEHRRDPAVLYHCHCRWPSGLVSDVPQRSSRFARRVDGSEILRLSLRPRGKAPRTEP